MSSVLIWNQRLVCLNAGYHDTLLLQQGIISTRHTGWSPTGMCVKNSRTDFLPNEKTSASHIWVGVCVCEWVRIQISAAIKLLILFWRSQKRYVAISQSNNKAIIAIFSVSLLPLPSYVEQKLDIVCVLPSNGYSVNYEAVCKYEL
jgi:hypothetical protein